MHNNLRLFSSLPILPPILLLILLPLWLCGAAAEAQTTSATGQPEVEVTMNRAKGYPLFEVAAHMTVDAGVPRSWAVLTDYDRLAEFVPNLSTSQVLSRNGNERTVSQNGFAKFLFIRQAINLVLHVSEEPMDAIDIRLISGNMREYQARWELQPVDGGRTRVSYAGVIAPDFYVPTLFGAALMKSDLRNMLAAVKTEIEKDTQKEKRP